MFQCPVYQCYMDCKDNEGLMKHYKEGHPELSKLGLDMVSEGTGIAGRITNTLLNQLMIVSVLNKQHVRDMMKQLNEEVPLNE